MNHKPKMGTVNYTMEKFYVDEVPEDITVAEYLQQKTNFWEKIKEVKPRRTYPKVIVTDFLNLDLRALGKSIQEALQLFGDYGWMTRGGRLDDYTGFSLAYNPNHQDGLPIHASTLGTPKNSPQEFYWDTTQHHAKVKNSYFDTYGFCIRTPASKHSALGEFINRSKRTLVRSRTSVLHGDRHNPELKEGVGWHKDEIIFENLRVNVPVVTSQNYLFQITNEKPVHLSTGFGYTWNTNLPHRVFSDNYDNNTRIHVVLGFSPWFDYLPEEGAWVKNEFFGRLHPFDMLAEGHIFDTLKIRDDVVIY